MAYDPQIIVIPARAKVWQISGLNPQTATPADCFEAACVELYRSGEWLKAKRTTQRARMVAKLCGLPDHRYHALTVAISKFYSTVSILTRSSGLNALVYSDGHVYSSRILHSGWNSERPDDDEENEFYG